ncbi:trissin receptor [Nematostella vectensis]|uniref:trissin receptor n=1 Tax=Nematostella vectensis TaxID=45351 RepID=UPI00207799EA|nr:trissin receptor [Nematostella vectensis]XP_032238908.2 trissin receptor [Nematostella vectensis]XP_032238910.2 trissin receptor [Nematostella vectensis]XP_048578954.1 trissin receptor [Nematostella vectensis]XP_048578955.1 trissin receptor [Nematostella vectensis]
MSTHHQSHNFTVKPSKLPLNYTTINITMNTSTESGLRDQCPKNIDSDSVYVIKLLLYFVAMVISFVGNTMLIYAVKRHRRMRSVTNFLIVNMAASDLFITVFNMPTYIEILITRNVDWIAGSLGVFLCKLVLFIQGVSVSCSVLSLTVLAIHRYLSVMHPLKKLLNRYNVKYAIVGIWLSSLLFMSPLLYALNVVSYDGVYICDEKWGPLFDEELAPRTYTVVLFVLLYASPLLIMAVLYGILIFNLWFRCPSEGIPNESRRQSEDILSINRPNVEEVLRTSRSKKLVLKMLVTVVVVFALCWIPMHVRSFLYFFDKDSYPCGLPTSLDFIGYFLGHVNSALNPCIYMFFSEGYRQTFKGLFFSGWRKRKVKRYACAVELRKLQLNVGNY